MTTDQAVLALEAVSKTFTLHLRDGLKIGVVSGVEFRVAAGECVVLGGPSGAGKSSILKMIYGNYRASSGRIHIRHAGHAVDLTTASPREVLATRRRSVSYVSQFLRVIPRVAAIDIVVAAARETGVGLDGAEQRAKRLLRLLNLPERLWGLPPATFSGGEQQRINIARGLAAERPLLLLDEPTASLDAANRAVVVDLICEKKAQGVAIVGIFHDEDVRHAVADRVIDVTRFAPGLPSSDPSGTDHDRCEQLPH
jgi:alpha-D-ribose 1-methylphosphonate 5-triphosphate synthase subunit PhnL